MTIQFNCREATVQAENNIQVLVMVENPDITQILSDISISDIIDHYGKNNLLDEIGEDETCNRFNLKPSKE